MNEILLARLGLSRLRLPIPMAKLLTVHAAVACLNEAQQKDIVWKALLQWISEIELESEVVEALCIPVLGGVLDDENVAGLQRAIKCPSPLSHLYLGEIFGQPLRFISWAKAHSGEAPEFFPLKDIIEELTAGHIVPHILAIRIQSLESASGFPLLRQWAYEYQRLVDIHGDQSDGQWEHFVESVEGRGAGHFITRRGHVARSAFLRTLSLAYDAWDMPENAVYEEAMYATAADFTFLRMLPGKPPPWAYIVRESNPMSADECQKTLESVFQSIKVSTPTSQLLHLDMSLASTSTFQGDIEVISCLHEGKIPEISEVFRLHDVLLGKLELPRTGSWDIQITSTRGKSYSVKGGGRVLPALVPAVGRHIGYFSSELIQRTPYLPANLVDFDSLYGRSRKGGIDIVLNNKRIGKVGYWNQDWEPTHDKALGPHCGVSLVLSESALNALFKIPQVELRHFWRTTILTRTSEYGEWKEENFVGVL